MSSGQQQQQNPNMNLLAVVGSFVLIQVTQGSQGIFIKHHDLPVDHISFLQRIFFTLRIKFQVVQ